MGKPMDDAFSRLAALYDPAALSRKTVVCIGTGGARGFIEDLARCGVGRFVLLDGDKVEPPNLATQGVFTDELGRNKAECAAERIRLINPEAQAEAVPRFLDDDLDDSAFAALVGPVLKERPRDVLIAGCTDHFFAQARSAQLALQFGAPYLAAQLYAGGLGGEIFFCCPGVTTGGCPRCAMSSRYRAYLEEGYRNEVTTDGAAIFTTNRLNALKGQIALMLLLYGEPGGGRYRRLLEGVRDRNFVLVRMSPGAGEALGLPVLDYPDAGRYAFFDETLWIPQKPDGEPSPCPLCGGEADLTRLAGTFEDTRILR